MGEDHDASPRNTKCSELLCRGRDVRSAPPSPTRAAGTLPEISLRVSHIFLETFLRLNERLDLTKQILKPYWVLMIRSGCPTTLTLSDTWRRNDSYSQDSSSYQTQLSWRYWDRLRTLTLYRYSVHDV